MISVQSIYRYPLKGLSGQQLGQVACATDARFSLDRRWGVALNVPGNEKITSWQSKRSFFQLAAYPKLASLQSVFDEDTQKLQILRKGRIVAQGALDTDTGRQVLEAFFAAFLKATQGVRPQIVCSQDDGGFTDKEEPYISVINLASVRDIARASGQEIDPMRFRGNLYIDGGDPWQEWSWVGGILQIGDVRARVVARITRCKALNADPQNGEENMNVPQQLMRGFGHCDCGVFIQIIDGGTIPQGVSVSLVQ